MKKKRKASPPRIQPIRLARLRWRRRYSASSNGSGGVSSVMRSANGRRPPRRTGGRDRRQRKRIIASRAASGRSEEHTSELQSLMRISYAVFCLKKKKKIIDY